MTRDSQDFQYLCTYPYAMLVHQLRNYVEKLVCYYYNEWINFYTM